MTVKKPTQLLRWWLNSRWHHGTVTAQADHVSISIEPQPGHDCISLQFGGAPSTAREFLAELKTTVETFEAAIAASEQATARE